MSTQEAIEILEAYREPNSRKQNEAMDMAVSALRTLEDAKGAVCNILGDVLHRMHGVITEGEGE